MDRRDLLKLGAASALSSCAPQQSVSFRAVPPPNLTDADVDTVLADLDATLVKLGDARPTRADLPAIDTLDARKAAHGRDLMMRTLGAMHIAATFRELPQSALARPEVQRRMWSFVPATDDAMLDMVDYLASCTPAEKRAIQAELRRNPSAAMDAVGRIDAHAGELGIPARRRAQMRAIAAHASWRMTRQSVDALLGDTLDRVARIKERHGRDAVVQRAMAAKVAEAQLFENHTGRAHVIFAANVNAQDRHAHRVAVLLGIGGALLGSGAIVAGTGALMLTYASDSTGIAGAFVITAGALLGLAGLIVLIVGAAVAASTPSDPPADPPPDSNDSVNE